ncbi:MAG: hypothetical protein FJZ87_16105 [Chloroflexi bacterium]|nr:hypothetical protein [Chloroflexota bacterium]
MSNNNLFRYGGIAAIANAILYVLSLGMGFAGITGILVMVIYAVSSLLLVVALIVLYVDLRAESAMLALLALVLLGALTIWSLFLDPTNITPIWGPFTVVYGIGFVIFGWLQRNSSRYPNGLGVLAIVTGVVAVIAGIALMAGANADIFGLLNLILTVPFIIWSVRLGMHFLKGKA